MVATPFFWENHMLHNMTPLQSRGHDMMDLYQETGDGTKPDHRVAAEVGVSEDGTDDRQEIGGSRPEEEDVGSSDIVQAVLTGQVHHHVGQQSKARHFLKRLIRCT